MIDICLISWQTEFTYEELQHNFRTSATYHQGVLADINHPLREPPTGLLVLGAVLENAGYSVDIIDCMILEDPEAFFQENGEKYRIFGFTCLTNTFPPTIQLIKNIRKRFPHSYIVAGGPHFTFTFHQDLLDYPEIDIIFQGEAEKTLVWTVDQLLKQPIIDLVYEGRSSQVSESYNGEGKVEQLLTELYLKKNELVPPGIAFRQYSPTSSGNELPLVISTGFPDVVELKGVPLPARHLISRIYQVADIIVNRGCPNQCSFCSRTKLFPIARVRPLKEVLHEVDMILSSRNYRFINFYDNINVNHQYFNQFLDSLIDRNAMLPWGAELRADVITQDETHKLKQANCQVIATGIESSSQDVLKRNFKFQNPEKVKRGIQYMKQAGLAVQAYFIIGLPGDTPQRFDDTLQFAKTLPFEAGRDQVDFFLLTPYPGSDLATYPEKYGVKFLSNNYSEFNCHEILVETEDLDINKIKIMIEKAQLWKTQANL